MSPNTRCDDIPVVQQNIFLCDLKLFSHVEVSDEHEKITSKRIDEVSKGKT